MGFEHRHRGDAPSREELAAALARAHRLELERSREVLRRAEQAAAEDPQARSVRRWFAILVEERAHAAAAAGRRTEQELAPEDRERRARGGVSLGPGRQTLVGREAGREAERDDEGAPRAPGRDPGGIDVAARWR